MQSYDVLDKGLDWVNADGEARREEAGAIGVTDLIEADIPGLLKDGLIRKSEAEAGGRGSGVGGRKKKAGGKKR